MEKRQVNLKVGDSVVFSQRYLPSEPQAKLHSRVGKVNKLLDEGVFVLVEFNYKPGILTKVFSEDLELLNYTYEDIEYTDTEPLSELEDAENHELGGMSRAQLIQYKLDAQENDPALDRSINSMLN